jgi:hypothetical protein
VHHTLPSITLATCGYNRLLLTAMMPPIRNPSLARPIPDPHGGQHD